MGGIGLECICALKGICPIEKCGETIYYLKEGPRMLFCRHCCHIIPIDSVTESMETKVHHAVIAASIEESKVPELVAFRGIHNFEAKLLSPFLTRYGMDKDTGKPMLLSDMNMAASFDCGIMSNKIFRLNAKDIHRPGVGADISELTGYLSGTLLKIDEASNRPKSCVPGHADPDGHCLVHAISRCLTGTQLFWHPLREELHRHLRLNLSKYQKLLGAYITDCEWPLIVEEADPYYLSDGATLGLRNVHVFALANILKRPIILLDSPDCMDNAGDFSATFLPILTSPTKCKDKNNVLNSPIVIAWASRAHNHFVPIMPVNEVILPTSIIPPVWLESQERINEYCEFVNNQHCSKGVTIGHGISLSDNYINKLINAMRQAFHAEENISTKIVSRLYRDVYMVADSVPLQVSQAAKLALSQSRLHSCQVCGTIGEIDQNELKKGGHFYEIATETDQILRDGKTYELPNCLFAKFSKDSDTLILDDEKSHPRCRLCDSLTSIISTKRCPSEDKRRSQTTSRPTNSRSIRNIKKKEDKRDKEHNQPSGSGNLRIKVRISDEQSGIMELSKDITVATFLTLLTQKFGIEVDSIHSIRSGHPPRVLDQTRPQSTVTFLNGDKVEVMLGAKNNNQMLTDNKEERIPNPSSNSTRIEPQIQKRRPVITYSDNIPSDVQALWRDAENNAQGSINTKSSIWNTIIAGISDERYANLFSKSGGYYTLTCSMKGVTELTVGEHYTLMELNESVFHWNGERFQLCTGPESHKDITDISLYTVTTNDFKHNCVNLQRLAQQGTGPGINRLRGAREPPKDISDELRKRLLNKR